MALFIGMGEEGLNAHAMTGFTDAEKEVISLFVAGRHKVLGELCEQIKFASVANRLKTDFGFLTEISLDSREHDLEEKKRFQIADVYGAYRNLAFDPRFILWIDDGRLSSLECFCFDPAFSINSEFLNAYYVNSTSSIGAFDVHRIVDRDEKLALASYELRCKGRHWKDRK